MMSLDLEPEKKKKNLFHPLFCTVSFHVSDTEKPFFLSTKIHQFVIHASLTQSHFLGKEKLDWISRT